MYNDFIYNLLHSKLTPVTDTKNKNPYGKSVHIDQSRDDVIIVKVNTTIRFVNMENELKESIYEYIFSVPYGQELMDITKVLPELVHTTFGIHLGITISLYKCRLDFVPTLHQIKDDLDSNPFVSQP